MANKHGTKAGIFNAWDGKLTGSKTDADPQPMPNRNQTWGSVQNRQRRTFSIEEVKELIAEALSANKEGREPPNIDVIAQSETEEEIIVGGK